MKAKTTRLADSHRSIVHPHRRFVFEVRCAPSSVALRRAQIAQLEMAVKGTPELYREQIAKIRVL